MVRVLLKIQTKPCNWCITSAIYVTVVTRCDRNILIFFSPATSDFTDFFRHLLKALRTVVTSFNCCFFLAPSWAKMKITFVRRKSSYLLAFFVATLLQMMGKHPSRTLARDFARRYLPILLWNYIFFLKKVSFSIQEYCSLKSTYEGK